MDQYLAQGHFSMQMGMIGIGPPTFWLEDKHRHRRRLLTHQTLQTSLSVSFFIVSVVH